MMNTVIGLSGSLRENSFNTALLHAASERAPDGLTVQIETIQGIPLYNGDVENSQGIPRVVQNLKDRIAETDGLLLATPEYNHSMPGVFKNAIDWLSRPPADIEQVFGGTPVAMMGATPGGAGTRLSQVAWLTPLRALGTRLWTEQQLYVSRAHNVFDEDGQLVDEDIDDRLTDFMDGFHDFLTGPT